ncbi:MAG: hypothetical protein JNJ58_09335 [Chitinophagaceae bacterium]|nr:hypothetical protein [Chitinophagaceae bacterium]
MSYSNLSVGLTPTQITSVNDAITHIKDELNFLVQLTPEEKQSLSKLGDHGFSYVHKAIEYAGFNPHVIPPSMNYEEGKKDMQLFLDLRVFEKRLRQLLETVEDTRTAAGVEAKNFADQFYALVKLAAQNKTPGMDSIAEDLGSFYEKSKSEAETPAVPQS